MDERNLQRVGPGQLPSQVDAGLADMKLQQLEQSGMLEGWVSNWKARNDRIWDHQAWLGLVDQVRTAGYWPIDLSALGRSIETLYDIIPEPRPRTRPNQAVSASALQTVTEQGTAAWVDPSDLAVRRQFDDGSFFFGRCPETNLPLGLFDDRHVLMVCGSRSGKGTGYIIPNHLLWEGPLVSWDPKGENASVCAARRGDGNEHVVGMGQKTCVLDPFGQAKVEDKYRARFNPLDELDAADPDCYAKAGAIANAMVIITGRESDDYWKEEARSMIQAIILYIVSDAHFGYRRDMATLRELIVHGDLNAVERAHDADPSIPRADPIEMLFGMMGDSPAFDGELSGAGKTLLSLLRDAPKQWQGIHRAVKVHTDWIADVRFKDCMSGSDFALSEFKANPRGLSVFICLPTKGMATNKRFARIILNLMAYEFQESLEQPACGHPILMSLDEFGLLEHMSEFHQGIAFFAGYSVKLLIVVQSIVQLREHYKEGWESFVQNASLKIFADLEDISTTDMVSRYLGEIELVRGVESRNVSLAANRSIQGNLQRGDAHARSINANRNIGGSVASGEAVSDANSVNQSKNSSVSGGRGRSRSYSLGETDGYSYDRNQIFFRNVQEPVAILRGGEKRSRSTARTEGGGDSEQEGYAKGETSGTGQTNTRSSNTNLSYNAGGGIGYSDARTLNESLSLGIGEGEAQTHAAGMQQVHQVRALLKPNEIRKGFARIDDRSNPMYPGLALVLITGEDPAIVRRTQYFDPHEDLCDGLWDTHPGHPRSQPRLVQRQMPIQIPALSDTIDGGLWLTYAGESHGPVIHRWVKRLGDEVTKNEIVLEVVPGPTFTGLVDTVLPVFAPVSGYLDRINLKEGDPFVFESILGSIGYDVGEARLERDGVVNEGINAYNDRQHPEYHRFEKAVIAAKEAEDQRREEAKALADAEAEKAAEEAEMAAEKAEKENEAAAARLKKEEDEFKAWGSFRYVRLYLPIPLLLIASHVLIGFVFTPIDDVSRNEYLVTGFILLGAIFWGVAAFYMDSRLPSQYTFLERAWKRRVEPEPVEDQLARDKRRTRHLRKDWPLGLVAGLVCGVSAAGATFIVFRTDWVVWPSETIPMLLAVFGLILTPCLALAWFVRLHRRLDWCTDEGELLSITGKRKPFDPLEV